MPNTSRWSFFFCSKTTDVDSNRFQVMRKFLTLNHQVTICYNRFQRFFFSLFEPFSYDENSLRVYLLKFIFFSMHVVMDSTFRTKFPEICCKDFLKFGILMFCPTVKINSIFEILLKFACVTSTITILCLTYRRFVYIILPKLCFYQFSRHCHRAVSVTDEKM